MDIGNKSLDGAHESNIQRLIDEFGSDKESEIQLLYQKQRMLIEAPATILEYTPIFTYDRTRQILRSQYKESNLQKSVKLPKVLQQV